jgi:hypothetical protein
MLTPTMYLAEHHPKLKESLETANLRGATAKAMEDYAIYVAEDFMKDTHDPSDDQHLEIT